MNPNYFVIDFLCNKSCNQNLYGQKHTAHTCTMKFHAPAHERWCNILHKAHRSQPQLHGIRYRFLYCHYIWLVCTSPKTVPRRHRPLEICLKAVPASKSRAILLPCSRIEHSHPSFIFWRSSVVPIRILQEYWSHTHPAKVLIVAKCFRRCSMVSQFVLVGIFRKYANSCPIKNKLPELVRMLWRSWFRVTCRLVLYSYACYFEEYTGQWQNLWRTLCSAVWKSHWRSKLRGIVFPILTGTDAEMYKSPN